MRRAKWRKIILQLEPKVLTLLFRYILCVCVCVLFRAFAVLVVNGKYSLAMSEERGTDRRFQIQFIFIGSIQLEI